jgi:hypothetical protein
VMSEVFQGTRHKAQLTGLRLTFNVDGTRELRAQAKTLGDRGSCPGCLILAATT